MQLSISLKVLILLFGPYVWLRSMACFENPTCYLCLLGNSTRLSNSPKVILGSSPGEHLSPFDGAKPSSLGKGWLISRSPAFPGANYVLPRLSCMPSIFTNSTEANSQAFNWVVCPSPTAHFFTYNMFISKLRDHLTTMGIDPQSYAGHSFRRGGASFAYQSGVPVKLIKALGDWRSDTILIYLTMPLTIRLRSANMLCKSILNTHTT